MHTSSKHRLLILISSVTAGVLLIVGLVSASTTISTNIQTDGTLSVTGASTLTGTVGVATTTPWALLSVNPNALGSGVPEFAIGSSTATHLVVTGGGNVGIGTSAPNFQLEVVKDGGISFATLTGYRNGQNTGILNFQSAHGTLAAPSGQTIGDYDGSIVSNGYDGAGFQETARIAFVTSENFSGSAHGTGISFQDTNTGTTVEREVVRIAPSGNVGIGISTPQSPLQVTAGASATTTVTVGSLGLTSSKACVNMNRSDGGAGSFYINATGAGVFEPNYCR